MTHPCLAQKFCKSSIKDWKLKTNPRRGLGSPRPRAIGSAAAGRRGGKIGAANPTPREIFGVERRTRGCRPAPHVLFEGLMDILLQFRQAGDVGGVFRQKRVEQ